MEGMQSEVINSVYNRCATHYVSLS